MKQVDKAKKVVKETGKATYKTGSHLIYIGFTIIVVYTIVVSVFGFLSSGPQFIENVNTLGIGGFWAFFMGYFGWNFAARLSNYLKELRR